LSVQRVFLVCRGEALWGLTKDGRRQMREVVDYLEELDVPLSENSAVICSPAVVMLASARIISEGLSVKTVNQVSPEFLSRDWRTLIDFLRQKFFDAGDCIVILDDWQIARVLNGISLNGVAVEKGEIYEVDFCRGGRNPDRGRVFRSSRIGEENLVPKSSLPANYTSGNGRDNCGVLRLI